jgi:hypothetical protein
MTDIIEPKRLVFPFVAPLYRVLAIFMMLIAVAVFIGGGGKCSIDKYLPKEL